MDSSDNNDLSVTPPWTWEDARLDEPGVTRWPPQRRRTHVLVVRSGEALPQMAWQAGRSIQFAALWTEDAAERRAALRVFGDRCGPLGLVPQTLDRPFPWPIIGGRMVTDTVTGESLEAWEGEARAASVCVQTLWQQKLLTTTRAAHAHFRRITRESPPDPVLARFARFGLAMERAPSARVVPAGLAETQQLINAGLLRHGVVVQLTGADLPFQYVWEPRTLGGHVWHEIASFAAGQTTLSVCVVCGRPILYQHSYRSASSKRDKAKFCSDACRVKSYRLRLARAKRARSAAVTRPRTSRQRNVTTGGKIR